MIPSVFTLRWGVSLRETYRATNRFLPSYFAMKMKRKKKKRGETKGYQKVTDRCGIPWNAVALSCFSQKISSRINFCCISLSPSFSSTIASYRYQWSKTKPICARRHIRVASFETKLANRKSLANKRNNVLHDRVPSAGTTDHASLSQESDRPRYIDRFDRAIFGR